VTVPRRRLTSATEKFYDDEIGSDADLVIQSCGSAYASDVQKLPLLELAAPVALTSPSRPTSSPSRGTA
jgi:hypothetical protein